MGVDEADERLVGDGLVADPQREVGDRAVGRRQQSSLVELPLQITDLRLERFDRRLGRGLLCRALPTAASASARAACAVVACVPACSSACCDRKPAAAAGLARRRLSFARRALSAASSRAALADLIRSWSAASCA
jgi:hypothetical protein